LRWTLSKLRKAIGGDYILADRQEITFNLESDYWLDVADFEAGQFELFRGEFLEGLHLRDALRFEDWLLFERERLRGSYQSALSQRLGEWESRGDYQAVVATGHQLLRLDNLREEWYRALMRAYARQGQREAALAQFELCCQILETELGVQPGAETFALAEAIRQDQIETTEDFSPAPPHTLGVPPQPTPFIGREEELAALDDLITSPELRLVTIVGLGGIGKTRLAIQAATESLDFFNDGVCFVPLAPISSDEFLVATIAESLNFFFRGAGDPQVQLLNHLREKATLLVLDNFEHILDGATLLSEIVLAAPQIKLLVTSRERLNLREEWVFELEGMTFPASDADQISKVGRYPSAETSEVSEATYSAVQLFEQRARQARADFDLTAEYPAVVRICQLTNGMPLGLELAATWVKLMSCQEIAVELAQNLDFLAISMRNVPERHRSLRAVFEHSWQLLYPEEQAVFRELSVFRGGFTREAAEQVTGASLPLLSALVDKSLLGRNVAGRYDVHELLRQYGGEKLLEAGETERIRDRHLAFFLKLAEEAEPELEGSEQVTWLNRLEIEHDNLRAAVGWSRTAKDTAEESLRLTGSLGSFWDMHGFLSEGREHLSAALSRAEASDRTAVRAKALDQAARLAYEQGDYPAVRVLLEEGLSIYRELDPTDRLGLAHALRMLGITEIGAGNYTKASSLLREALGTMRELNDQRGIARALWQLGWCAIRSGDYEGAVEYFAEPLSYYRQTGDKNGLSYVLSGLGEVALRQGDYERATALLEESLVLRREVGDKWGVAVSLGNFAWVALRRDDLEQAVTLLAESMTLRHEIGDVGGITWCLEKFAEIALTRGQAASAPPRDEDFRRAARLFGAAEALRAPSGSAIDLVDQAEYERQLAIVRAQLDEADFGAAWAEGQAMTLERAVVYALAE
jgi:predicted ATPase